MYSMEKKENKWGRASVRARADQTVENKTRPETGNARLQHHQTARVHKLHSWGRGIGGEKEGERGRGAALR